MYSKQHIYTNTYIHQKAILVEKSQKGSKKKEILIEMKINNTPKVDGQDKVSIFTDKTYYKKKYSL